MMGNELKQLKYNQARLAIIKLITEKRLQVGERLPSKRELVHFLPFGEITILHALKSLNTDGIIDSRHGSGTYLKQNMTDIISRSNILYIYVQKHGLPFSISCMESMDYLKSRGIKFTTLCVESFGEEVINAVKNTLGIVVDGWVTNTFYDRLCHLGKPVITVGNRELRSNIPNVSIDLYSGTCRMTRYFIQEGLTKIALLVPRSEYLASHSYNRGYLAAMNEANLTPIIRSRDCSPEDFFRIQRDAQVFLLETVNLFDYLSMICRNNQAAKFPAFGFLNPPDPFCQYRQHSRFQYLQVQKAGIRAVEILYHHIANGEPLVSEVLMPYLENPDPTKARNTSTWKEKSL